MKKSFKDLVNPSKEIIIKALKKDGHLLQHIKDQTEELQLIATQQNGYALQHCVNPSEAVQLSAVTQDARAVQFIEKPTQIVISVAIKQNPYAKRFVRNEKKAMVKSSVKLGISSFNNGRKEPVIKEYSKAIKQQAEKIHKLILDGLIKFVKVEDLISHGVNPDVVDCYKNTYMKSKKQNIGVVKSYYIDKRDMVEDDDNIFDFLYNEIHADY